jgi:hypothetical protein
MTVGSSAHNHWLVEANKRASLNCSPLLTRKPRDYLKDRLKSCAIYYVRESGGSPNVKQGRFFDTDARSENFIHFPPSESDIGS